MSKKANSLGAGAGSLKISGKFRIRHDESKTYIFRFFDIASSASLSNTVNVQSGSSSRDDSVITVPVRLFPANILSGLGHGFNESRTELPHDLDIELSSIQPVASTNTLPTATQSGLQASLATPYEDEPRASPAVLRGLLLSSGVFLVIGVIAVSLTPNAVGKGISSIFLFISVLFCSIRQYLNRSETVVAASW